MSLRTVFGEPGHYTAHLIPTAPGHYRFRFFGAIEGMEVDETFHSRSGGGGFDDVQPATELQFPESLPETREIEAAVRGAQGTAQEAQDTALQAEVGASSARVLTIVGIALGVVGVVAGVGSTVVALRR
jgi:hypothetical protein